MTSFFSADGGPIWIKFRRLVQNDMSTGVMWSKSKPDVEFQYGGCFSEFNGVSSQSHVSHCRVLPLGEFIVTIPEPHATLQGVRIPSVILKIVFRHFYCKQYRKYWVKIINSVVEKEIFRPTGATRCPDKGPLPRAKFHVYRGRNVGIQPPKLSKFRFLAISLPLRGQSFAQFLQNSQILYASIGSF